MSDLQFELPLASHRDLRAIPARLRLLINDNHCRLEFSAHWHSVSTVLSHDELGTLGRVIVEKLEHFERLQTDPDYRAMTRYAMAGGRDPQGPAA